MTEMLRMLYASISAANIKLKHAAHLDAKIRYGDSQLRLFRAYPTGRTLVHKATHLVCTSQNQSKHPKLKPFVA